MNPAMPQPTPKRDPKATIETKIERSSLGTTDARRMRARTSITTARAILSRAAAYPHRDTGRNTGRKVGG